MQVGPCVCMPFFSLFASHLKYGLQHAFLLHTIKSGINVSTSPRIWSEVMFAAFTCNLSEGTRGWEGQVVEGGNVSTVLILEVLRSWRFYSLFFVCVFVLCCVFFFFASFHHLFLFHKNEHSYTFIASHSCSRWL